MRVLIVGGSGYIGFHIGLELQARGHEVTLFDLCPPNPMWFSDVVLSSDSTTTGHFPFVQGSILSLPQIEDVLAQSRPEGVVHCGKSVVNINSLLYKVEILN